MDLLEAFRACRAISYVEGHLSTSLRIGELCLTRGVGCQLQVIEVVCRGVRCPGPNLGFRNRSGAPGAPLMNYLQSF
jgi:hypothetical protein